MTHFPHPALIVFGGLPGTGKTTVSRALSKRLGGVYLRIDAIEQALRNANCSIIGAAGYGVGNAIALANLQIGHRLIVDCVNPVAESLSEWRRTAASA